MLRCLSASLICLLLTLPTAADPPSSQLALWPDLPAHADALRQAATGWLHGGTARFQRLEIVEMVTALARGSLGGPGEAWYHPGQSRYDWKWLAARYDTNNDGRITRAEFTGPAAQFDQLDRNRDGVLTSDDLDWSKPVPSSPANQWFPMLDTNGNGRISPAEWEVFFRKAAGSKGYLTPDDLRAALQPPAAKITGPLGGKPTAAVLFKGLLAGEVGSPFEGPSVGQSAPDFSLRTHDGKQVIRLSQFRGNKPVVLVFGSFT
jgi:hypothetical protein